MLYALLCYYILYTIYSTITILLLLKYYTVYTYITPYYTILYLPYYTILYTTTVYSFIQEELKERFQDVENDAKLARDEVTQLLSQREEWEEMKITLEQSIDNYKYKYDEKIIELQKYEKIILEKNENIIKFEKEINELNKHNDDQNTRITELEIEISNFKELEIQLNNKIKEGRIALSREKSRVEMYQNVTVSSGRGSTAGGNNNNIIEEENTTTAAGTTDSTDGAREGQADSPYTLQQELHIQSTTTAGDRAVRDIDDEDATPAALRCLVPSVTRQAHIQAIQSSAAEEDR